MELFRKHWLVYDETKHATSSAHRELDSETASLLPPLDFIARW